MDDPEASKPDDWDEDAPEYIPDPEASKPEEWDADMDGEWVAPQVPNPVCAESGCGPWEAPQVPNPDYKGPWEAPQVPNPDYKGPWAPRQIPNPGFYEDKDPARLMPIAGVGIDIWTMSDRIMFDNILLTTSEEEAEKLAESLWRPKHDQELEQLEARRKPEPDTLADYVQQYGAYLAMGV